MATKKASAPAPADLPPPPEGLTRAETRSVAQRKRLRAAVVYEIIRVEGEGELARSFGALWWSALAAGLSIGFSVLAQGMLKAYLPNTPGAAIVENLGYSVGFLIVILGRQQLFTENTLTAVLPVSRATDGTGLSACSGCGASCCAANARRLFLVRGLPRLFDGASPDIADGIKADWRQADGQLRRRRCSSRASSRAG